MGKALYYLLLFIIANGIAEMLYYILDFKYYIFVDSFNIFLLLCDFGIFVLGLVMSYLLLKGISRLLARSPKE